MAKKTHRSLLRRFNNFLSVIVAIVGLYLILWPMFPKAEYWWQNKTHHDPPLVKAILISKSGKITPPPENTIVIPSIHLQKTIYDGLPYPSMDKGVWHDNTTSTPDKGGNTVLAGHRFMYYGTDTGATFYNLDKVNSGDMITVFWQGKRYDYRVAKTFVVPPSDAAIKSPTKDSELTLYTCTPLWTAANRLVVQANLVNPS